MPAKPKGENSKKAAGNAQKAEAAAAKKSKAAAQSEAAESAEWNKGAKSNAKKDAAADKAAEAARKKAEKAALLAEEEASQPSKPKASKTATKKGSTSSKGTLDLGQLEEGGETAKKQGALNASGIDNALDALSLANNSGSNDKVERHPERRFKAAYSAFEERRLEEMKDEKGLRRQQKIDQIRKEFEKHPDNPFNQALVGGHDMTKEEMRELREGVKDAKEARLGGPS